MTSAAIVATLVVVVAVVDADSVVGVAVVGVSLLVGSTPKLVVSTH